MLMVFIFFQDEGKKNSHLFLTRVNENIFSKTNTIQHGCHSLIYSLKTPMQCYVILNSGGSKKKKRRVIGHQRPRLPFSGVRWAQSDLHSHQDKSTH